MSVVPRQIRVYEDIDGREPFNEWLHGLRDRKARAVVGVRLARVRLGNLGDCASVGEGVFELRIDFGPGYRVYYAEEGLSLVLLLVGGDKSTQVRDIRMAKKCWADYKGVQP